MPENKKTTTKNTKTDLKKPVIDATQKGVAIIALSGRQYLVKVGDQLKVEKLTDKPGKTLELTDMIHGKKVVVKIGETVKQKKIHILKFKSKTRYTRKMGHRQLATQVSIENIT